MVLTLWGTSHCHRHLPSWTSIDNPVPAIGLAKTCQRQNVQTTAQSFNEIVSVSDDCRRLCVYLSLVSFGFLPLRFRLDFTPTPTLSNQEDELNRTTHREAAPPHSLTEKITALACPPKQGTAWSSRNSRASWARPLQQSQVRCALCRWPSLGSRMLAADLQARSLGPVLPVSPSLSGRKLHHPGPGGADP